MFSVAVRSSSLSLAIKLSLPRSTFELVSLHKNTGVWTGHPLGHNKNAVYTQVDVKVAHLSQQLSELGFNAQCRNVNVDVNYVTKFASVS